MKNLLELTEKRKFGQKTENIYVDRIEPIGEIRHF